jgi:hypothetical protein
MNKRKNETIQTTEPQRPRRLNPLARYVGNRLSCALLLFVLIVGGCVATAFFAPTFFQQTIRIAQNAGLSVYTLVLGVTGNPALQLATRKATVNLETSITRDMGIFGALYGESATVKGTVFVTLGADLKNGKFGVLSCEVDYNSVRSNESRALFAGSAFDQNAIKQQAYIAFSKQAAEQAIEKEWLTAKKDLEGQFVGWGLGVQVPAVPTLRDCPANLLTPPTSVPATP